MIFCVERRAETNQAALFSNKDRLAGLRIWRLFRRQLADKYPFHFPLVSSSRKDRFIPLSSCEAGGPHQRQPRNNVAAVNHRVLFDYQIH